MNRYSHCIVLILIFILNILSSGKTPKNLHVLEYKTVKETNKYMKSVSKDLGVKCIYCHDMKDKSKDTPNKLIAREMIRMNNDLNSGFFTFLADSVHKDVNSITQISCWTCHQGKKHPELVRP